MRHEGAGGGDQGTQVELAGGHATHTFAQTSGALAGTAPAQQPGRLGQGLTCRWGTLEAG